VASELRFEPLTPANWEAFETLFGERGACGGCWCMLWRLPRREFDAQKGEGNRKAMRALVKQGIEPGILAFDRDQAVGWCALAPREDYPALARSRVMKPIDDQLVWSVACLFIDRVWRGRGVASALLEAAADFARERGARILEGYPVDPAGRKLAAAFAWTGIPAAFERAGFTEVARGSPTRPIMRRNLENLGSE
jgi:GNAT superfamily N-acetyltransferase